MPIIHFLNYMETLFELLPLKKSECTVWRLPDDTLNIYDKYTQENEKYENDKCLSNFSTSKRIEENKQRKEDDIKDQNVDIQNKSDEIVKETNKKSKKEKILPSKIITNLCHNSEINYEYIKKSFIEFLSQKGFQKMFGVKKTSEVMKGLAEDKWNKSFVLFISFIFNKVFIYLKKEVSFYPLEGKHEEYISL